MGTILKKIGYLTALILPALLLVGYELGGWWIFSTFIFSFVIIPLMDLVIGRETKNVEKGQVKTVTNDYYYRFVTYLWVYVQMASVIWGCYAVSLGTIDLWYEWVGLILGMGLVTGGIGITVAHELGHKKSWIEKFYAKVLLMTVYYMHFYIEHNKGHHVHVATPKDPATARKDENFYLFWIRSVFGSYQDAWNIEKTRLKRNNKSVLSFSNNMIWFTLLPLVFCASLMVGFFLYSGTWFWQIPVFFFAQSFIAFTLLEIVNYIEHYGIVRKEIEPGKYERVNPLHSWNANQLISNFFLFQLQRHSDHHANAIKRYQVLNHYNESPQLPASYPSMIILALVPPLWFSMMNRRLSDWQEKVYNERDFNFA